MKNLAFIFAVISWTIISVTANAADRITPPGSHISLEPPAGFLLSKTFAGFAAPSDNASIVLTEFPAESWQQLRQGITAEAMAQHGMRLLSTETIDGLPYEQVTARAEQRLGNQLFDKWLMFFNAKDFVGIVTVTIASPAPPRLSDAIVRAALASVRRASSEASGNPVAALPFTVQAAARFKYRKALSGRGLVLKETPPPPEGQPDDVGFIVTLAGDAPIAAADQQRFAEQQFLTSRAITDKNIQSTKPLQVTDGTGFEILAQGKQASGRPLRYLFVVVYPSGHPFVMVGSAPSERFDEALPDFRAMIESFRSKL